MFTTRGIIKNYIFSVQNVNCDIQCYRALYTVPMFIHIAVIHYCFFIFIKEQENMTIF